MKHNIQNSLSPGQFFAQYKIDSCLGYGAMGIVYKAFDPNRNKYVALKILQKAILGEKHCNSFVREVKAIAQLNHKNIVKLYDVGSSPTYYFTMEYVAGRTLAEVIATETLSQVTIAKIFSKLALALYHAHMRNIVHGDIKPTNIIISENFEPKITDFGLAREKNAQRQHSGVQGTPAYLSPEQLNNSRVDKRSDIYALGVTMYRTLTGKLPFDEKSAAALFYQISHSTPPLLRDIDANIAVDFENICLKCLEKSPENRYANGKFLYKDLQDFLSPPWHSHRFVRKCLSPVVLELLLVLSLVYCFFLYGQQQPINEKVYTLWEFERDNLLLKECKSHLSPRDVMRLDIDRNLFDRKSKDNKWKNKMIHRWSTELRINENSPAPLLLEFARNILRLKQLPHLKNLGTQNKSFHKICSWGRKQARKANNLPLEEKFITLLMISKAENEKNNKSLSLLLQRQHTADANFYLAMHSSGAQKEQYLLQGISCEMLPYLLHELVVFYHTNYLHDKAIFTANLCLKKNPYDMLVRYYLAVNLGNLKKYSQALYHLDFIDKHHHEGRKELLYLKRAEIYLIQNKWQLVERELRKVQQWMKERHYSERPAFQDAIRLNNDWMNAFSKIHNGNWDLDLENKGIEVEIYCAFGKMKRAHALIKYIKNPVLRLAIYRKLFEHKQWKEQEIKSIWQEACDLLLSCCSEALENEKHPLAVYCEYLHFFLGRYHGNARDKYLRKSLILRRRMYKQLRYHYERYASEAYFCYESNDMFKAIFLWEHAMEKAPWYREFYQKLRDYAVAKVYIQTANQRQQGLEILTNLQEHYSAANILLAVLYRSKDVEKARLFLQKINPDDLFMRDRMDFYFEHATLFLQEKKYAAADKYFYQVLDFFPRQQITLSHLIYSYMRQNKWQLALDTANKLVSISKNYYVHDTYMFVRPYERRASVYEEIANRGLPIGEASYAKAIVDWQQRRKHAQNENDTKEMARIDYEINRIQKKLK